MLTFIGLLIIGVIVWLLLTEKVSPIIALILVPLFGALLAGFDVSQIKRILFGRHQIGDADCDYVYVFHFVFWNHERCGAVPSDDRRFD